MSINKQDNDNPKQIDLLIVCINLSINLSSFSSRPMGINLNKFIEKSNTVDFKMGWCGGDPGWEMAGYDEDTGETYFDEDGHPLCRCWLNADIFGIEPEYAFFRAEVVRHHIKIALEKIAKERPERAEEAHSIIARYHLDPENKYDDTYKSTQDNSVEKDNVKTTDSKLKGCFIDLNQYIVGMIVLFMLVYWLTGFL